MITVRKLKVRCEDTNFYTWIRKEQREQNKALNIAIGYIHTKNILHSVDSGAEDRINKSINKLQNKIDKLKLELENPKLTDKKRKQTQKALNTNLDLLEGEKKILNDGAKFRQGLDKQFSEIYIDNNNLLML